MWIIDADAHVCETKDLFTSRLPKKYGDAVPHVKFDPKTGKDFWFVGDVPIQSMTGSVMYRRADGWIERREDERHGSPRTFEEQHPSSYDPNERVKIMDAYGIRAATTFPFLGLTGPDVYRAIPSADLVFQMQVVSAYNDWILTWAAAQPGRFIPLACVPYWELAAAVDEIQRCAAMGMKGLVMTGKPQNHGCPILDDRHWDPLWAAAQDAGLAVCFHVAGGRGGDLTPERQYRRELSSDRVYGLFTGVAEFLENAISAIDLMTSGVLQRYPRLHFAIVESGAGWVPFVLESLDHHYKRYKPWLDRPEMKSDELPSDLFRRQIFVNTWFEETQGSYPLDNLMFETDYPHPTCLIGDEITNAIDHGMAHLSADDKDKVLWRNAMRCFKLDERDLAPVGGP